MTDRQCPSCGGFCKKLGCERENVQKDMTETKKKFYALTVEEVEQAMEQSKGAKDRLKKFYELLDDMLWKKNKLRQYKEKNT